MKSSFRNLSALDVVFFINMGIACAIAYAITTSMLASLTSRDDDLLGGMWAAVATAFVFRDTRVHSLAAGFARFFATCISFGLCLIFLTFSPPTALAIPILVTAGSLIMVILNRREDIVTMAITTIVVMVVAIISPSHARAQPILRLIDTVIGIAVGVGCKWTASALFPMLRRDRVDEEKSG